LADKNSYYLALVKPSQGISCSGFKRKTMKMK